MKKILVLGSTGAMAVYLIPELLKKGYSVVGVSLDDAVSDCENLTYIKADASAPYDHYTILRPAITYSKRRFQLVTLEANVLVYRMLRGKTVVLPESAMDKEATMSWAGDVAKMIATVILNPKAFRQTYNVSTSEHMKWREVAKIYQEIGNLKYIVVDDEAYLDIIGFPFARCQLFYDRCFNRIVDNRKILSLCGMKQEELMPLKEGLMRELKNVSAGDIVDHQGINERMDHYLESIGRE